MSEIRTKRRFSFHVSLSHSPNFVPGPWPRTLTPHRHPFGMQVQRYRRRRLMCFCLLLGSMLSTFPILSLNLPNAVKHFGFAVSGACFFVALVVLLLSGRLKCPACNKRLEPAVGEYCPQCGSDQFQYGRHRIERSIKYCPSCDSTIGEDDGDSSRSYRIRGCTHCGVMLHEKGL